MARRVFVPLLAVGRVPLSPEAAHHLLDVLRLEDGAPVEPFDAAGRRGVAVLRLSDRTLEVAEVLDAPPHPRLTVASAVPKGDRADYLVEKLAELAVTQWVPLETARAVVLPKGDSKRQRWDRIAQEAARQSHAPGLLAVADLTRLDDLPLHPTTWFCSTAPGHLPASAAPAPGLVLVGPEGGWTDEETATLVARGALAVTLGPTVLRTETACVVAAALALSRHTA